MKKGSLMTVLCLAIVLGVTGCGKEQTEGDAGAKTSDADAKSGSVSAADYDIDKYVTLGDYEGLEVSVPVYNFTDQDVETEMQGEAEYYINSTGAYEYKPLDKDTVEDGDIVNIDYVGTKEGVAFEGGTAQGAHLTIGSGQFIDGFESGLIGHKVGEKVSLNLTFPEQYQSAELAGQAVVFDVTINSIDEQSMPEINDQFVQLMGMGLNTVEEFREDTKKYLTEQCEQRNLSEKRNAVWQAVFNTCSVKEPPQELVDDVLKRIQENLTKYATQYGVTEDVLITQYMGTTKEQYDIDSKESAVNAAKEKLVAAAIAKQAGITLTDEELKEFAEKDASSYGYDSGDKVLEEVGKGAYYDFALGQKVDDYLVTKVKVSEQEPVSIMSTMQENDENKE